MSDFAHARPDGPLYRVARAPDPWVWPAWSHAGPDGTFGNRYDDPQGSYRVLYASSSPVGAYMESLARFRVDLSVIAGLAAVDGAEEIPMAGLLPRRWVQSRVLGEASADGDFIDVGDAASLAVIRTHLAAEAIHHGLADVDAATIRLHAPRRFTQAVSRLIYEWHEPDGGCAGIRYCSRLGDQLVNWAIFEPVSPNQSAPDSTLARPIAIDDPDLRRALDLLRLTLG